MITAKRWGGDGARFVIAGLTFLTESILATSPSKFEQLHEAGRCLFYSGHFVGDEGDEFEGVGSALDMLSACIEDQLESFRAGGIIDGREFTRLSQAFALWRWADTVTKAMDFAVVDVGDIYDYFGVRSTGMVSPKQDVEIIYFDDPEPLIDELMIAWINDDRQRLAELPIAESEIDALGTAPGSAWMVSCEENASGPGPCLLEVGYDHPDRFEATAFYTISIEMGDISGWNIQEIRRTGL
jgi:hypothetical protein